MSATTEQVEAALAEALVREIPSLTIEQAREVLGSAWLANAQQGAVIGSQLIAIAEVAEALSAD